MPIRPAVLALATLVLAACASNPERLSDANLSPKQRADCVAAESSRSGAVRDSVADAPAPWCKDERDEAVIWRSGAEEPMQVDFERRDRDDG